MGSSSGISSPSPSPSISCYGFANYSTAIVEGVEFLIEADVVKSNDNLGSPIFDGSFNDCLLACATNALCVDLSYTEGQICYLKGSLGTTSSETGTCDAVIIAGPSSSSSVVSTSSTPSSAPSSSLTSPSDSSIITSTIGTASGTTLSLSATSSPATCACGQDGSVTAFGSSTYQIFCGFYYAGNPIGDYIAGITFSECAQNCSLNSTCDEIAYYPDSDGSVGTTYCYLYQTESPQTLQAIGPWCAGYRLTSSTSSAVATSTLGSSSLSETTATSSFSETAATTGSISLSVLSSPSLSSESSSLSLSLLSGSSATHFSDSPTLEHFYYYVVLRPIVSGRKHFELSIVAISIDQSIIPIVKLTGSKCIIDRLPNHISNNESVAIISNGNNFELLIFILGILSTIFNLSKLILGFIITISYPFHRLWRNRQLHNDTNSGEYHFPSPI
ncbi:hypothetical protein BU16DRAFT_555491 [Lophium mytilinum]|uniref:Apple domain-containing protein n=1 Tax=Lophium mytilinum TaxID=390894 RepID=A0A6A6R9A5_9PEZI|nr:hypothetical protein BU16DRAFT_555491 [Lophium mytilinum]